jgi:hypothetical protein
MRKHAVLNVAMSPKGIAQQKATTLWGCDLLEDCF